MRGCGEEGIWRGRDEEGRGGEEIEGIIKVLCTCLLRV